MSISVTSPEECALPKGDDTLAHIHRWLEDHTLSKVVGFGRPVPYDLPVIVDDEGTVFELGITGIPGTKEE